MSDDSDRGLCNETDMARKNIQLAKALEDLKQAQHQLIQQEKLACIGQLVAGVAHEINNPLGFITSNAETARMYFANILEMLSEYRSFTMLLPDLSPDCIQSELERLRVLEDKKNIAFIKEDYEKLSYDIEEGLRRITDIISGLNTFSRMNQNCEHDDYNLNQNIKKTLFIAKNNIKYYASVKESLGEIPIIQVCGDKINQVLLNLILNSSQAIKDKQAREKLAMGEGLISITTYVKDNYVCCMIEDNGIGIDEVNKNKIFDPFFTTKPIGEGTGLGLSIGYDIIVNQHNGQLLVESTPMVGTQFVIMLPIHPRSDSTGD